MKSFLGGTIIKVLPGGAGRGEHATLHCELRFRRRTRRGSAAPVEGVQGHDRVVGVAPRTSAKVQVATSFSRIAGALRDGGQQRQREEVARSGRGRLDRASLHAGLRPNPVSRKTHDKKKKSKRPARTGKTRVTKGTGSFATTG